MTDTAALVKEFEAACKSIENAGEPVRTKISMRDLLELYALFKQSKVGDCNTARPRYPNFKGMSQWDAWKSKTGMTKEETMTGYCDLVKNIFITIESE
ncbi:acyl-CoA-binding protein-like [Bolinopsis microptera]|uniref:acyl-CoA-binding protein-like n=1 Tax=Bolinopsis microptera TaxID=2820187 RepID=UPI0030798D79